MAVPAAAVQSQRSRPAAALMRHGVGASGFIGAKAMVFLAPLLLLRTIGVHDYGIFEFALAWGTPLAVLFCIGAGAAIPFFLLKRNRPAYLNVFRFYAMVAGVAVLPAAAAVLTHVISFPTYLAILITIIFVLQTIYASEHRTFGAPAMASLAESGNYVLVVAFVAIALVGRIPVRLTWIAVLFTVYALIASGFSFVKFDWSLTWPRLWRRTRKVMGYGFALIATGLLTALLTSSGRLLAGAFFSMDAVGVYSLFLRLASAVILIHQLMNTLIFPRVYKSGDRALDAYFSGLMLLVFLVSLSFFYVAPHLLWRFLPLIKDLHGENRQIFFVFGFQMVFWAGMAMMEIIINRENIAKAFVGILLGCTCLLAGSIYALHAAHALTLLRLCQLNMSCIFLAFLAECLLLRWRGVKLGYILCLGTLLFASYFFAASFIA